MDKLQEILRDTAEYVAWKREEGETTAEVSPNVLQALAAGSRPTMQDSATKTSIKKTAAASPSAKTSSTVSPAPTPSAPKHASVDTGDRVVPDDGRSQKLHVLAEEIQSCTKCPLHMGRIQAVPGQGNPNPEILFIGEAPGADEDEQGLAFVGRAGQLLTKMIVAMGYTRDEVFIANVNKCRPPNNRKPLRAEMDICLPFLRQQVALLQPKVLVALGATAVEGLVPESASEKISTLRGNWLSFEGIPLMPTYHPAYLLRSPTMKKPVWEDLQAVLHHLGRPIPKRTASN